MRAVHGLSYLGLFVPWTIRTIDGLFVPWTVRTMDYSYRPWTFRTLDCSYLGLFVPSWTVRTVDCSYHGLYVPWTVLTDPGQFVPCWERQHSLYSVSKKIPPEVFWHFFPKRLGIFSPNFTGLLHIYTYGRLQIFIQLSPTLTNLYHIRCDHPACVSADGGHFDGGRAIYGTTLSKLQIIK